MIYGLYYASRDYQDYQEVILFYNENKEFIEAKRDKYTKLYDYLNERASKFFYRVNNKEYYNISIATILDKYYKKLGIPFSGCESYGFGIQEIRTYDEFTKKFGIK